MNPMLKCCGVYCSCLAFFGIILFAIMIVIVSNENPYLIKGLTEEGISDKITALIIAIIVNAGCFVGCAGCVSIGMFAEKREAKRIEEEELRGEEEVKRR